MHKALLIKNADFSANAMAIVDIDGAIHCTGIELSVSTVTMTRLGSEGEIVATVTPGNTTDSVLWSSSDPTIVSVADGVITQKGVGSVTITATCGVYSATCDVTATNVLQFSVIKDARLSPGSTGFDYVIASANSSPYAILAGTSVTPYTLRNDPSSPVPVTAPIYPIRLGNNAATITTSGVSNIVEICYWTLNCDEMCEKGQSDPQFAEYAKKITGDPNSWSAPDPGYGNRVITVTEGANSVVFALHQIDGEALTDEDIAAISITVTAASE